MTTTSPRRRTASRRIRDTCICDTFQDNGAGLSWSGALAAGASTSYSQLTVFSPTGAVAPSATSLTKTAERGSVTAGGADTYTITVHNENGCPLTLSSLTDHLPAGFTYLAGTTTGLTTADPVAANPVPVTVWLRTGVSGSSELIRTWFLSRICLTGS